MIKKIWKKFGFYIVTGGLLLIVMVFSLFFGKVIIISGASMEPTYHSGDVAVALKVYDYKTLETGDICVFKKDGRELIKRVSEIRQDGFWMLGDNTGNSKDSREFGVIPFEEIQYKVAFTIPSVLKNIILYGLVFVVAACFSYFYLKGKKSPDAKIET